MFDSVVRVREQLGELVAGLDPHAVSAATARELWEEFNRIERLAAGAKTLLAVRMARTHQPDRSGSKTAAEELARRSGTGTGSAKDAISTSQRLPNQPGVDGALRRGELSTAQAATISDAAAADPTAEQRLIELAGQVSLGELRAECLRVKAAADPEPEATHRRIHNQRRLRRWTDPEGGWNLSARGTADDGAAFNAALDPIIDQIFKTAHQEGLREPHEAYAFDALMHLADHATGRCTCGTDPAGEQPTDATVRPPTDEATEEKTDQPVEQPAGDEVAGPRGDNAEDVAGVPVVGAEDDDGAADLISDDCVPARAYGAAAGLAGSPADYGDLGTLRPAAHEPSGSECPVRPSSNPRYLALLRVDAAALRRGHLGAGELCEINGVGPVPVSVARRLLGDAVLKLVITRGVDVLNVTHLGRGPTAAQRAAVLWTNPTCSVQGCNRTRIEFDHRVPWATSRHTRLDELDGLCGFHHDLRTRLGYALIAGVGKRALVAPDDPRHPNNHQKSHATDHVNAEHASRQPPRPRVNGGSAGDRAQPTLYDLLAETPRAP